MLIIGERINASRQHIAKAILSQNAAFIQNEAKAQGMAGADYIDVNAGTFVGEEAARLKWVIQVVQEAVDLPLCIDSSDPDVIENVLPLTKKPPMINSITLDSFRMKKILPLVVEHQTKVIALCQKENTMAETLQAKIEMAGLFVNEALRLGIPIENLYIDPLVYPLATHYLSASVTLSAIEEIVKGFPGVHTTCGLTNISYGLPARKLVNRTFLSAAIQKGLDSVIMDPTDRQLYGTLKAALMVAGKDEYCAIYLRCFREDLFE
ncbi:MAG: methyltetrahydrofolate cobalamin methyltransferase [Deltaproteobacteria bacterium]|nr:methyltetrahydrofolate cobalamin methyltransferase [Deltaproteobacteria bacterium]